MSRAMKRYAYSMRHLPTGKVFEQEADFTSFEHLLFWLAKWNSMQPDTFVYWAKVGGMPGATKYAEIHPEKVQPITPEKGKQ